MMLLNMQFYPSSFYFFLLVPNNVLKTPFSVAKYQVWFMDLI
jgi:hypothetical protein